MRNRMKVYSPAMGGKSLSPYYYILVQMYRWLRDKPLPDFWRPYTLELADCSALRGSISRAVEEHYVYQLAEQRLLEIRAGRSKTYSLEEVEHELHGK